MQIDEPIKFIEKVIKALPEESETAEQYNKFVKGVKNAKGMLDGNMKEEKTARIQMDCINAANHAAFTLFRLGLLTDELEKEYRALKTAEAAKEEYEVLFKARNEADDAVREQVAKAQEAQKEMDVFVQVIGGASKEEAERRIESYRQSGGR